MRNLIIPVGPLLFITILLGLLHVFTIGLAENAAPDIIHAAKVDFTVQAGDDTSPFMPYLENAKLDCIQRKATYTEKVITECEIIESPSGSGSE